jgi:hypothetical protein
VQEKWLVITAVATALAAFAALISAFFTYLAARANTKLTHHNLGWAFEDTLTGITPKLRQTLGEVTDSVPPDIRDVMLPFLVLYSQVWVAHQQKLFPDANWQGMRPEFAYWMRKPAARSAWQIMRRYRDAWPEGFVAHVDLELTKDPPLAEKFTREPTE